MTRRLDSYAFYDTEDSHDAAKHPECDSIEACNKALRALQKTSASTLENTGFNAVSPLEHLIRMKVDAEKNRELCDDCEGALCEDIELEMCSIWADLPRIFSIQTDATTQVRNSCAAYVTTAYSSIHLTHNQV